VGFFNDPDATANAIHDGWLATGDLGSVDVDGRVVLSGRRKELIIRAGVNVYPVEVEGVLLRHPGIAEAYVVGLEHPILGETVGACVVAREGASLTTKDVLEHCHSELASYKCPQEVRLVAAVTKTSRGKVMKANLKMLFG
jgi:acyl-CoA synthetase (AMP-forming)/AMP-acid ligase II